MFIKSGGGGGIQGAGGNSEGGVRGTTGLLVGDEDTFGLPGACDDSRCDAGLVVPARKG